MGGTKRAPHMTDKPKDYQPKVGEVMQGRPEELEYKQCIPKDFIFDCASNEKWNKSIKNLGINLAYLSSAGGEA